jgi:hypothetical protein
MASFDFSTKLGQTMNLSTYLKLLWDSSFDHSSNVVKSINSLNSMKFKLFIWITLVEHLISKGKFWLINSYNTNTINTVVNKTSFTGVFSKFQELATPIKTKAAPAKETPIKTTVRGRKKIVTKGQKLSFRSENQRIYYYN